MNQNNSGYFLIDKPCGWTSYDCVRYVSRKYGFKKTGHAGSLDPIATGLLVVMVNDATRWFDRLQKDLKVYEATLLLGASFDSQDITGNLAKFAPPEKIPDRETVLKALLSFIGETEQVPPVYSAIKIHGKPAYQYARKGTPLAMPSRKVYIESMELLNYDFPHVTFRVTCKKGFYVRALCEDIAGRLSTISVLCRLRRTAQSGHRVNESSAPWDLPDDPRELLISSIP